MSAVQGIVRGHGACMFVDSKAGLGTVIRLAFPAIVKTTSQFKKPKVTSPNTILVVDDEKKPGIGQFLP